MGLNPLIAACSYIFHVFFILPEELEINILFIIHSLCVFVFSVCVFLFIHYPCHHQVLNFTFWKTCRTKYIFHAVLLSQQELRQPTGGSSLPLFAQRHCFCCCFWIQCHWQHTGPNAQWVMNELPFITINQWAKPINCQVRDEFVSVRMTDCLTAQMHQTACGSREKVCLNHVWALLVCDSLFFVVSL